MEKYETSWGKNWVKRTQRKAQRCPNCGMGFDKTFYYPPMKVSRGNLGLVKACSICAEPVLVGEKRNA